MKEDKVHQPEAPTPEELRSEPLPSDEALVEEAPKVAALPGESARDALDRYFREMVDHPLLSPEAEQEAAREIEELEVTLWRTMLGHPQATPTVMAAAEAAMENSLPEFETLRRLLQMRRQRPARFRERGLTR